MVGGQCPWLAGLMKASQIPGKMKLSKNGVEAQELTHDTALCNLPRATPDTGDVRR